LTPASVGRKLSFIMEGTRFDEGEFFRRIAGSQARALLIGRRALIAIGIPVLTADYDFWVHPDDVASFNAAVLPFDLRPNRTPEEARSSGRYVLENDEHVDVLLARCVSTHDGESVSFEDVWARRLELEVAPAALVAIPTIDDLIATKRFSARPKDAEDIRLLEVLRQEERGT
jgi:hypothetical protein